MHWAKVFAICNAEREREITLVESYKELSLIAKLKCKCREKYMQARTPLDPKEVVF